MMDDGKREGAVEPEEQEPVEEQEREQQGKVLPFVVRDRRHWAQEGGGDVEEIPVQRKPTVLEELERRLASQNEQLTQMAVKQQEAYQEFDEVRTRLRQNMAQEVDRGRRHFLAELLDVMDNMDRAIEAAQEATDPQKLLEGVTLVRNQFLAKLKAFGVEREPALGQPFDPERHEAVSLVPVAAPEEDGVVVGVISDCYVINGEVLRPARVAVGKASS